ncbi:MAG: type II toxin-antitoxin system Phd/YefM family antitoxin [Anaerolineae bacterium]|nr:type II toxin-antitoxin system Phd/YefM family antitoxin [Anaerolineae bacterium]
MTVTVSVYEAKALFSELLDRVVAGEEVLIADAGKPVARLMPFVEQPTQRTPGTAIGKITIAPDFDDPLPDEILDLFEA